MINYGDKFTLLQPNDHSHYIFKTITQQKISRQSKRAVQQHTTTQEYKHTHSDCSKLSQTATGDQLRPSLLIITKDTSLPKCLQQAMASRAVIHTPNPNTKKQYAMKLHQHRTLTEWNIPIKKEKRSIANVDMKNETKNKLFMRSREYVYHMSKPKHQAITNTVIESEIISKIQENLHKTYKELSLQITSISPKSPLLSRTKRVEHKEQALAQTQTQAYNIIHRNNRRQRLRAYPFLEVTAVKQSLSVKQSKKQGSPESKMNAIAVQCNRNVCKTINVLVVPKKGSLPTDKYIT